MTRNDRSPMRPFAFSAISCHARHIVDERQAATDKAIEECRLAHIRAADDSDGKLIFHTIDFVQAWLSALTIDDQVCIVG